MTPAEFSCLAENGDLSVPEDAPVTCRCGVPLETPEEFRAQACAWCADAFPRKRRGNV